METNFSTQFSSDVLDAYGAIAIGDLLLFDPSVSAWVKATSAARTATGLRAAAIALSDYGGSAVGKVAYKDGGVVSSTTSGLGTGAATWIRTSSTGRIERVVTPVSGDDVIGRCSPDGRVTLQFGVLTDVIFSGTSAVADDIAKSTGATIDRVQGFRGVPLDAAALSNGEVYRYLNGAFVGRHAMPKRWYDPRDYGAALDGAADDIAAFEALHADLPTTGAVVYMAGIAWLSRTWRVSKRITLLGWGGEQSTNFDSGFFIAPGRTAAVQLDYAYNSLDGGSSSSSVIKDVDFKSRILIHYLATGSDSGRGIPSWGTLQSVSVGDCRAAAGSVSSTKFFRLTSTLTNSGKGPAVCTALEPAWNTTVGGTTTDGNGNVWTCEKFPTVHATSTAYAVGDRVVAPSDNRFIFRCTVAGTSAGARPSQLVGGTSATGMTLDATFTDGTVTWTIECANAIRAHSNLLKIQNIRVCNFSGGAGANIGGISVVAAGITDANNNKWTDVFCDYVGFGLYMSGDNCNGYVISNYWGINVGSLHPTPNIAAASGYSGLGGHHIIDNAQAGGLVIGSYGQLATGRMIYQNGLGRITCVSVYAEVNDGSVFKGGTAFLMGGSIGNYDRANSTSIVGNFDPDSYGCGLREVDRQGAVLLSARMAPQDGHSVFEFAALESGDPNNFGWRYGYGGVPTGCWGIQHGQQNQNASFILYGTAAGLGYGAGLGGVLQGLLYGDKTTETPIADYRSSWIAERKLRGGARKQGDRFRSQTDDQVMLEDGYRGRAWTASTVVGADFAAFGINATVIEPTANTGKPGEQVWKCTTAGTTGGAEPAWPASPTAGVTTQADGTAVWTFLGSRPARVLEQRDSKARGPHYRAKHTDTTTGANQLIMSGGVRNGEDMSLPYSGTMIVSDIITLGKPGADHGGKITIETHWRCNGTAAPVLLNTVGPDYSKLVGTTLDGTTVSHVLNGRSIDLWGDPETAENLSWNVFRTQLEGID